MKKIFLVGYWGKNIRKLWTKSNLNQKIKSQKLKNWFFIRFRTLHIFHKNRIKTEGGGGVYISLVWKNLVLFLIDINERNCNKIWKIDFSPKNALKKRLFLIDLNEILTMKPVEFQISYFFKGYDTKNCRKLTKFQQCWRVHNFQTMKDIEPKFRLDSLKTWVKVL